MIKNFRSGVYLLISGRKSESQQKLPKKITYFTRQFRSKNLTHFTNLNSLNIIKNILPQHSQKHASGWCQKKSFTLHNCRRQRTAFLEHLERKCLYIPVNLCSKILFQERRKLLSGGGLNNFLQ